MLSHDDEEPFTLPLQPPPRRALACKLLADRAKFATTARWPSKLDSLASSLQNQLSRFLVFCGRELALQYLAGC